MDIADGVEDAVKHPGIIVSVYSRAGDGVLDAVVAFGMVVSVHAALLTIPTVGTLDAVVHEGTIV